MNLELLRARLDAIRAEFAATLTATQTARISRQDPASSLRTVSLEFRLDDLDLDALEKALPRLRQLKAEFDVLRGDENREYFKTLKDSAITDRLF